MKFKQSLKMLTGKLIGQMLRINPIWNAWNLLPEKFVGTLRAIRNGCVDQRLKGFVERSGVVSGPFQGMRYEVNPCGSALWPKLLGTYESELWSSIESTLTRSYELAVDVGSAEGYYAVGIAKFSSTLKVLAYDVSDTARDECRKLAELNDVGRRVSVEGWCSSEILQELCHGRRTLVLSDCEGFERELFVEEIIPSLSNSDVLIECHEFASSGVSAYLKGLFEVTHYVREIPAVSPEKKLHLVSNCLGERNREILSRLVDEGRPQGMSWLFCEAIKHRNSEI